jgi:hypothetical protein
MSTRSTDKKKNERTAISTSCVDAATLSITTISIMTISKTLCEKTLSIMIFDIKKLSKMTQFNDTL